MEMINILELKLEDLESARTKLKCSRCGKLLSVFPVYYGAGVGCICGRCIKDLDEMILTGWLQRATNYELAVKHLEFPCCNNHIGCGCLLECDMVVEHEDKCRGKLSCEFVKCPAVYTTLTNLDLMKHLFNSHKEQYREHPLKVPISDYFMSDIYFTKMFNRVFLVKLVLNTDDCSLTCTVVCVHIDHSNEHQFYTLNVEHYDFRNNKTIAVHKEINSLLIRDNTTIIKDVRYLSRLEIYIIQKPKNVIATIEKKFNIITSSEKQKVENVINKFKSSKQLISDSTVPLQSAIIKTKLEQTDTNLLKEIECPICMTYMLAPIFICSSGHSVCKDCKEKINACPTCRAPIAKARSYTLEKLADKFIMPCRFKELGCQMILKGADIEKHIVNNCLYRTVKCPFVNCDMPICFRNITKHFLDNHITSIFKADDVLKKVLIKRASCNSMILRNDVFVLRFEHEDKSYPSVKFDCLHIDLQNTRDKYAFELQFKDQTNDNLKFVFRRLCKSNLADLGDDPLVLPIELLKPFITNEPNSALSLQFQCFIYKA